MPNKLKKDIVASITSSINNEVNFALIQFDKISHKSFEAIRHQLAKTGSKLYVIKNSLFEKSVNKLSQTNKTYKIISEEDFPLQNKSALLTFTEEWIEGLKEYYNFSKEHEHLSFQFGLFEKIVYNQEGLVKLVQLPSKYELMSKLIGTMKTPIATTTKTLSLPIQKLVYLLHQKTQKSY